MKKLTLLFLAIIFSMNVNAQYKWYSFGDTLNLSVESILPDTSSSFYVGGKFTKLGLSHIVGIAHWTGTNWIDVAGSGIEGTEVSAIAHYDGGIVAGGSFSSIDSISCNNVAYFDGVSWSPLGSGLDYTGGVTVSTFTIFQGNLYAGGKFITSAGDTLNNIAKWNGSAWEPLGTGVNGTVSSLCVYQDLLYVGGTFTNAGGVAVNNIAVWDGSTWGDVDGGVVNSYTGAITVSTMVVFHDTLYIGGTFQTVSGDSIDNIAKWDGSSWGDVGGGMRYTGAITVSTITLNVVNDKLVASGKYQPLNNNNPNYELQSWDGISWELMDGHTANPVYTVAEVNSTLFAGGAFRGVSSQETVNYLGARVATNGKMHRLLTQEQYPAKHMMELYPNPVTDYLYMDLIDLDKMSEDQFTFTLIDITGKTVSSTVLKGTDLKFQRTGIPAGIYQYELVDTNKNTIQKGKIVFR